MLNLIKMKKSNDSQGDKMNEHRVMSAQNSQHHSSNSSSSYSTSSETRVVKQSYQIQQQGGYQILPANHQHQQQFIQQSSSNQQQFQVPIQMAAMSQQQQLQHQQFQQQQQQQHQQLLQQQQLQLQQQQLQMQQQQNQNKEFQVPIQREMSSGSNQGMIDSSAGQFKPMDQFRPPVATAAANYQNTLQQKENESAINLVKPEMSSLANTFPTQWPPQDQVTKLVISLLYNSLLKVFNKLDTVR